MTFDGDLSLIIAGLRAQLTDLTDALHRSNMDYELLSRGIARQWPNSPLLKSENLEVYEDCSRCDVALPSSSEEFLSMIRAPEDIGALALAPRRATMHRMSAAIEHEIVRDLGRPRKSKTHYWIRAGKDCLSRMDAYLSEGLLYERERYPFIQRAIYQELLKAPVT